jgi:hypothetical protein
MRDFRQGVGTHECVTPDSTQVLGVTGICHDHDVRMAIDEVQEVLQKPVSRRRDDAAVVRIRYEPESKDGPAQKEEACHRDDAAVVRIRYEPKSKEGPT